MSYGLGVGPLAPEGMTLEQQARAAQDALIDSLPLPGRDTVQELPELVATPRNYLIPVLLVGLAFFVLTGSRKVGRGSRWE